MIPPPELYQDTLRIRGHVWFAMQHAFECASILDWADMFLGLDPTTFQRWTAAITKARWVDDPQIHDALERYCEADDREGRYRPFIELVRRVLELAPKTLDLGGKNNKFKIGEVAVVPTRGYALETVRDHGSRGPKREPDVLLVRKAAEPTAKQLSKWHEVLTWFELGTRCNGWEFEVETVRMTNAKGESETEAKAGKGKGKGKVKCFI